MPDETPQHPFDDSIALEWLGEDRWQGATSNAYWNMVGPFGGTIAALLLRAALDHPAREGQPVALTVNFCAALARGAFTIAARPARTNRSTQHWMMELVQADGSIAATGTALFGTRPDTFAHRPATPPEAPSFETLPRFAGGFSGWVERFDMRFAEGGLETGEVPGSARSLLWIASDPSRPLDFPGLAALCDIFFGRIIHVRRRMVPFGTITMTAYFHATGDDLAATGAAPLLGLADARIFDRGFHDQSAELWTAGGRLLATSHQLVYYRDPQ